MSYALKVQPSSRSDLLKWRETTGCEATLALFARRHLICRKSRHTRVALGCVAFHHSGESTMQYYFSIILPLRFDVAIRQTTDALKSEGFGIIT